MSSYRQRYDYLFDRLLEPNATDEETAEFETLQQAHPDWVPADEPLQPATEGVGLFSSLMPEGFVAGAATVEVAAEDTRMSIECVADTFSMILAGITALHKNGNVYRRGLQLVEVVSHEVQQEGVARYLSAKIVSEIGVGRMRTLLSTVARFTRRTMEGPTDVSVPKTLAAEIVYAYDQWPFQTFVGLAEGPTIAPDGRLITSQGYDERSGIYIANHVEVRVPEAPTIDDAKKAAARLLELVSDFDFASDASRSVWLSGVLSTVARPAVNGPVPLHAITATSRGSGKSKLVDVATMITAGHPATRLSFTDDDDEMGKRILALLREGDSTILLDNITLTLGGQQLDSVLTATTFKGRILGRSEMTTALPATAVWWATGNNLTIGGDLIRRTLIISLEPACERPEERDGPRPGVPWRHRDLLGYVADHRAEFLSDALTIIRAYHTAGRPSQNLKSMDFLAWSDLIRSAIVWVGLTDPAATRDDVEAADLDTEAFRTLIECWPVKPDIQCTTQELIELAETEPPEMTFDQKVKAAFYQKCPLERRQLWRAALCNFCPPARGSRPGPPDSRTLGYALRSKRGSMIGSIKLVAGTKGMHGIPWYLTDTTPRPNLHVV